MTSRGRRSDGEALGPSGEGGTPSLPALPSALVDEHARRLRTRSAASRVLARGRARRRVLPPLVVGSGALLGSSVIGVWVFGQVPSDTATAPTTTVPSTTAPGPGPAAIAADAAALTRLRQELAADNAAIAGLASSGAGAATGPSVTQGSRAAVAAPSASGGSSSAASSALPSSPGLPSGGGTGAVSIAPLAPLPTVSVPVAPPPVHTTTGATVVVH